MCVYGFLREPATVNIPWKKTSCEDIHPFEMTQNYRLLVRIIQTPQKYIHVFTFIIKDLQTRCNPSLSIKKIVSFDEI